MKLYEIKSHYRNILDLTEDEEFAGNESIIEALNAIEEDFEEKAINVVYAIKNFESETDSIDAEIKRLTAKKKARQNRVESLKEYLKFNMSEIAGNAAKRIETPLFNISLSAPRLGKVELQTAAENLPLEYQKIKVEADLTALKKALSEGAQIEGVTLTESRTLRIA